MPNSLLEKAFAARRESRQIEFKQTFDITTKQGWCELIKDLVAIANSGGGTILFGVNSRGEPTGADLSVIRALDPAAIIDKVHPYIKTQFPDFEIHESEKGGHDVIAWLIEPASIPMIFVAPGTYPIEGGKQSTAFGRGTIYFRHGAKSESGTTEDIAKWFERRIELLRKEWLTGVRKVVTAPPGSHTFILPAEAQHAEAPGATPIRVTDNPAAPEYWVIDPDKTHPFRQTELMREVRKRLPRGTRFTTHDLQCVRRVHGTRERREFTHVPMFGAPQYSQDFVNWIVAQAEADPQFFQKARALYKGAV